MLQSVMCKAVLHKHLLLKTFSLVSYSSTYVSTEHEYHWEHTHTGCSWLVCLALFFYLYLVVDSYKEICSHMLLHKTDKETHYSICHVRSVHCWAKHFYTCNLDVQIFSYYSPLLHAQNRSALQIAFMSHYSFKSGNLIGLPIFRTCWLSTTKKFDLTRPFFAREYVRVWAQD